MGFLEIYIKFDNTVIFKSSTSYTHIRSNVHVITIHMHVCMCMCECHQEYNNDM